jgi:plasmid maintenance system antidote protein VapI
MLLTNLRGEMSSPGAYVREELWDRGWSVQEFAERAELSVETAKNVISAALPVTPGLAKAIGRAFGTDSAMWLTLEGNFRRWKNLVAKGSVRYA